MVKCLCEMMKYAEQSESEKLFYWLHCCGFSFSSCKQPLMKTQYIFADMWKQIHYPTHTFSHTHIMYLYNICVHNTYTAHTIHKFTLYTCTHYTHAHTTHMHTHCTHAHTLHTCTHYTHAHMHTLHTCTHYTHAHMHTLYTCTHSTHAHTHAHTLHTCTQYTHAHTIHMHTSTILIFISRRSLNFCLLCTRVFDRNDKNSMKFDDFIQCCVMIKGLTESFQRLDSQRTGVVNINYETVSDFSNSK